MIELFKNSEIFGEAWKCDETFMGKVWDPCLKWNLIMIFENVCMEFVKQIK